MSASHIYFANIVNCIKRIVGAVEPADSFEKIANLLKSLPLHKPGENYTMDGYPSSPLALKLLEQHAIKTKKQVLVVIIYFWNLCILY
jgi:hypothetical protein